MEKIIIVALLFSFIISMDKNMELERTLDRVNNTTLSADVAKSLMQFSYYRSCIDNDNGLGLYGIELTGSCRDATIEYIKSYKIILKE